MSLLIGAENNNANVQNDSGGFDLDTGVRIDYPRQGICPSGWHVPNETEFTALATAVNNDGDSLKNNDVDVWYEQLPTEVSGFNAYPHGVRDGTAGSFSALGQYAPFWSATGYDTQQALIVDVSGGTSDIEMIQDNRTAGSAVRCIKD